MSKPNWAFAIRGEGTDTLELDIYDVIGENWWSDGVTAKKVRAALKAQKPSLIKVRINSGGGDVFDGFAIYNLLNEHPAKVSVQIDALAASMASVIAMAGDEIAMAKNAMMMIHDPWSCACGDADDFRTHAELLDKIKAQIADIYVAKTGKKTDDVLALMGAETWMTADEAVEAGFASSVIANKTASPKKAKASARAFAALNLCDLTPPAFFAAAIDEARLAMRGAPSPNPTLPATEARETSTKDNEMKLINKELGLSEDADEATAASAIKRLQNSSRIGGEIEKLVGAVGDSAVGTVRALVEAKQTSDDMAADLEKVRIAMARGNFDKILQGAIDNKKIGPPGIKLYTEKFDACTTAADAERVVDDIRAFAAAALRNEILSRKTLASTSEQSGGITHNGKTFAQMKHIERARLKQTDPELYSAMREEWEESGRPAA